MLSFVLRKMSSRYVTYCCDPLQCHKRRRTSGGSYNLRCVPITLINKFPSLQLTAKHKICPACRIKLYKLPSENVPVAEHCRDAGTSSGAVASVILPSDIVPGQPEDAEVSEVVPASDEMGVETEVSYNAVVSEAVTVSDEFSVETEVPNEVPAPDELGVEAQSGESFDAFITEEGTSQSGNDKSECSWADAECEVIGQLKEKFNSTVKRSEKVRILTILPKSWSVRKIMKEFGASNYMARQAKQLVQEKGILSNPNPKPGKTLSPTIEEHVVAVYLSDDVSRMMPGRKDCVSFMTAEGKRESRQKRLLLCSLKEAYEHLKSLHPSDKVGFSTFASLRPKECVLAGSSGTHSVCVCTLHQNTKLMFLGSKLPTLSQKTITHYRHCLAAIMCNPPSSDCYMGKCTQCPGTDKLHEQLQEIMDVNMVDSVQYQQWTQTDRSSLITIVQTDEEFLEEFIAMLKKLKYHDYIAKQQSSFVNELKENLKSDEYLVIADFSENYTCIVQDAIQSYHWHSTHVTIHPFLCYYQDKNGHLLHKCYVIISESTEHDTIAVHLFQKKLVQYLTDTFKTRPNKIFYVSDGCAAQYKNRKNFYLPMPPFQRF